MAETEETAKTPGQGVLLQKLGVKKAALAKAIRAVREVISKRSANTNPLFGSQTETISLQLALTQIPKKRRQKPYAIHLPFPLYDEKSEICFLSRSPQKQYKELLLKQQIPGLTKVIGLEKLKTNYKTAEKKRALADAFDLFVCDKKILELLPDILGSVFYEKKKKPPVPIMLHMNKGENLSDFKQVLNSTLIRVPTGPCIGIKIGRSNMTEEQLIANATAVIMALPRIGALFKFILKTISVQATDTPALPVWRIPKTAETYDYQKYWSDKMDSASETGASGVSDSEIGMNDSEVPSDAGETLSNRDSMSEIDTGGETMSEIETAGESGAEVDSEMGDAKVSKKRRKDKDGFLGLSKPKPLNKQGGEETTAPAAEMGAPPLPKKKKARVA